MGRYALFIDGGYLDKVRDHEFERSPIDLGKLADASAKRLGVTDSSLLRAYYYHCSTFVGSVPTEDQQRRQWSQERYFEAIRRLPRYEVRLGRLRFRGRNEQGDAIYEQKQADVLLAIDLVRLAMRQDITDAIIVAGDGDFVPAVRVAKDAGVVVHLLCSGRELAMDLWAECDNRLPMDRALMEEVRRGRA
jgi:uncharacterized LabA/DUF88 family protein